MMRRLRNPFRRSGPRHSHDRPLYAIVTGLATLLVVFGSVVVFFRTPREGLPGQPIYTVKATLPDIGNLRPRNQVRIAGTLVGQVLTREPTRDGRVLIEMKLSDDVRPLRSDTRVVVRLKGLLGGRFVQLIPGTEGRPLENGGMLVEKSLADSLVADVPEVLEVFDEPTRDATVSAVDGLGEGVLGRGADLNDTIALARKLAPRAPRIFDELMRRPGSVDRLLPLTDAGITPIDQARDDFAEGLEPGRRALQPFVDRASAVQDTLEEAPPTLDRARAGLGTSRRLLAAARGLATTATTHTLPSAPGGLREATALLRESPRPLRRGRALLAEVRPTVPPVLRLLRAADPVLDPAQRALRALVPPVAELGRHGCDVSGWAENWRSMLGFGKPGGGAVGPVNTLRLAVTGFEGVAGAGDALEPVATAEDPYPEPCKEYGRPTLEDYDEGLRP